MRQSDKARVFRNGRSQAVRIPAEFRFKSNEVYIRKDAQSGVVSLSEKPFRLPIEDVFAEFDAIGSAGFEVERDPSLPPDVELL